MPPPSRRAERRGRLSRLYEESRRGNSRSLEEFLDLAGRELRRYLDRRFRRDRGCLETREIATEAMEEVILHAERIPDWTHAWKYARTVAVRRALRQARKRKRFDPSLISSEHGAHEVPDPLAQDFQVRSDLRDALGQVASNLNECEEKLLFAFVSTKTLAVTERALPGRPEHAIPG